MRARGQPVDLRLGMMDAMETPEWISVEQPMDTVLHHVSDQQDDADLQQYGHGGQGTRGGGRNPIEVRVVDGGREWADRRPAALAGAAAPYRAGDPGTGARYRPAVPARGLDLGMTSAAG